MSTTVKRTVTVISACMTAQGTPTFVPQALRVTAEEYENGLHYALAEDWLTDAGFDEPFVHFADQETPAFLLDALQQQLAQALAVPDPSTDAEET